MNFPHRIIGLSAVDVENILTSDLAIASQTAAFESLGTGEALLPSRILVPGADDSVSFCYAARVGARAGAVCKFGSVNPTNSGRSLPSVSALVTVLDPQTGLPLAIMDAASLTTIRTSAASAVAARALARSGVGRVAMIGSGVQAAAHARALAWVFDLTRVSMCSPSASRSNAVVSQLQSEFDFDVVVARSAEDSVRDADIVVTCTTSATPVVQSEWIAKGATVISIGSFAADRCEVPAALLHRAAVTVVDHLPTALEHAGPVVDAVANGVISAEEGLELGDVLCGVTAREHDDQIVFYNSVGVGVQDAAAAAAVLEVAERTGVGSRITL